MTAEDHFLQRAWRAQEIAHRRDRDHRRLFRRIAVDAGADAGERDAGEALRGGEGQALAVARGQQFRLVLRAALPHRPDGMDHELGGQVVTACEPRLSGRAAAQRAAFPQQIRPRRAMDRAVHAATAEQRRVRGVDDGVDGELGDVGLEGAEGGHGGVV